MNPGGCDVEVSDDLRNSLDGQRVRAFVMGAGIAGPAKVQLSSWNRNHISMELHLP
jgi:hypothetical protein